MVRVRSFGQDDAFGYWKGDCGWERKVIVDGQCPLASPEEVERWA